MPNWNNEQWGVCFLALMGAMVLYKLVDEFIMRRYKFGKRR